MAEQPPTFVVVDKRKFTAEGERRDAPGESPVATPMPEPQTQAKVVTMPPRGPQTADADALLAESDDALSEDMAGALDGTNGIAYEPDEPGDELPSEFADELEAPGSEPLSPAESAAQDAAYRQTSREIDSMLREANPGAKQPGVVTFEHVIQSFYLSAVMAMGAGTEPGQQPRVDILGARQSIDMLGVLEEKTRGNLSARETELLQGITFELRMMFMELTNAISRQAQQGPPPEGLR